MHKATVFGYVVTQNNLTTTRSTVTAFCLPVCKMCGKYTFSQIQLQISLAFRHNSMTIKMK